MLIALLLAAAPAKVPARSSHQPSADQVAAAVDAAFPSYDLNGDGRLSPAEFAAMMTRLKERGDPKVPATRAWVRGAFASADKDRSRSVTRQELFGFLTEARS